MPSTETKWSLPTLDGKTIYGVKNSGSDGRTKALFIVHGLGGHMYEYHLKRAADYFAQNGYDVYRFNLYGGENDARTMPECTLLTHAEDLNTVLAAFTPNYAQNFVAGHSYGGVTTMLANPVGITAASMWDATFNPAQVNLDFASSRGTVGEFFTLNWGTVLLLNPAMEEHSSTLDEATCRKLGSSFQSPLQTIIAGDGYFADKAINYDTDNRHQNRRDVIHGTQHCFHEGDTCEELLAKTHAWFKQF